MCEGYIYIILKLCVDVEGQKTLYIILGSLMCGMAVGKHPLAYWEPQGAFFLPSPKPPPQCALKDICTVCAKSMGVGGVIHRCWRNGY